MQKQQQNLPPFNDKMNAAPGSSSLQPQFLLAITSQYQLKGCSHRAMLPVLQLIHPMKAPDAGSH